ncbi:3-deoxy-7-phosphoheptulonate synthase [Marinigracilibium pacificum]|uniref:3-deoxy-7-phosphoheptulonate synthase n=1 Tax=Marinigracilibium pacificum TaxID=2729599 RepID=A0A848J8C5_9BACT|nr:3-deoxy-7-phosphoheptulonate synthase [Marinigracilibium pacificum]NMM50629.1 3-deoxy-7-phosphoheptulonate synthase [Marinigracilibium pacificum]
MIIQLKENITEDLVSEVKEKLSDIGYSANEVKTQKARYLVGIGKSDFDIRAIGQLPGIHDIHIVSDDYKLVSNKWKVDPTVIDLGDGITIGGNDLALMSGPCSIEGEQQIVDTINFLKSQGVKIMRGGVYKPRSSPYSFRGMGIEGLKLWSSLAREAGLKIITEVMQVSQIEEMHDYIDIYQVGARNTQNFNLLDELGKVDKPVMIKRGISGTIDELLYSAEYVFSGGNEKLLLCERGIRTYEKASRNTFDINAIPILKEKTHLPVIADPSHGIGIRRHVGEVALASVIAGADGVIFESHSCPEKAYSDGQQTLDFNESEKLIMAMREIHKLKKTLY